MKKTISLILCVAMILSTVAFAMPAFAIDLDFDVEASEDYAQATETPEANLAGTEGNDDGKPGINVLTGTKATYGFEDTDYEHAIMIKRSEGIIADPDDADNRVMWLGNAQYANIGLTPVLSTEIDHGSGHKFPLLEGKSFEANRPFHVSFMLKGDMPETVGLDLMSGIGNAAPGWKSLKTFTLSDGMNWAKQETTITYAQATSSLGTFLLCFFSHCDGKVSGNFYIDDVSIIPDYLVSVYNADGVTFVDSEYVSYEETTYEIPEKFYDLMDNGKFLGFKLYGTEDSELVTSVNLANEDVKLVAVYDDPLFTPKNTVAATVGSKVEVTSKEAVAKWEVNDAELATVEGTADKATLTLAGYPGNLVVTAYNAENGVIGTKTIKLRGGDLARPGVNFITGTLDAYDFEGTDADRALSVYTSGAAKLTANPFKTGNTSDMVGQYYSTGAGQNYPQFHFRRPLKWNLGTRPMLFTFDYYGDIENMWINGNGSYRVFGGIHATEWSSYSYVWQKGDLTTANFYPQAGMRGSTFENGYIDNVSLVPYYKVEYEDATGVVVGTEYVLPEDRVYAIPEAKLSALDTNKYAGYAVKGTDEVVTEVALKTSDIVLTPVLKEGVEVVAPVVTGNAGITDGIDPKYPGAYYKFDEPLDLDTVTLDELKNVWADSFIYDEETNTLIVFSKTKKVVGHSEYFQAYDSNVKTESGKYVIFPKTSTLAYASTVVNDGKNMIPYGDFETAYNPFYTDDTTIDLSVEDGKLYATANTEESSYPHTAFQTVVEAGATYQVYAETKAIDVATAEPGINIVFEGDSEGGLVNHASVNNYHVTDNTVATIEKAEDGTLYFDAEFTVTALDNDAETAIAQVAMYSSPVDGKTVGYTIDNYELYRRTDVKYVPNDAVVSEGVTAPVDGAYLYSKGNVKNDEALVTVADYCYEAVDNKREVVGWISKTDDIIYEAGDVIDLTEVELDENGEYPLMPYVVAAEGYTFVDIKFETEGVTGAPKDLLDIYVIGDTLDMAELYEGVASAISGKRFNGWSIDGTKAGMVQPYETIEIEGDITFTPIVSYDFNFAVANNCVGWTYNVGGVTYEDNLAKTWHKPGVGNDCYFVYTGLNAPTVDVHKLVLWATIEFDQYTDKDHVAPAQKQTIKNGQTFEGLFFSHTGQGDHGERRAAGVAKEFVTAPDGTQYVGIVCDPTTNANWQKDGLFYKIRFDPNNIYGGLNFRYVEIRDYEEYDAEQLVIDMAAPEVGVAPDAEPVVDDIAVIDSMEWTPALSAGGNFKALTAYTAEIVLKPADKLMRFDPDMPVIVGGYEAEFVEEDKVSGAITVKVEFPETEDYVPFDFDLTTVPEEIVVENTDDVQLEVNITETTAGVSEAIVWTIEEGDNASITTDGLLTVYDAGTITVKAVSAYNENKAYTKDIVITLTDAVKPVGITFSDENIEEAPAAITRLAGTVLDLADYLEVKSSVTGMNFNGWTLDGTVLTGEIVVPEEDITLTAVVNYDVNMAVPANAKGWSYNGSVTHENDMLVAHNDDNTNHDVILQKLSGFNVPTADYGKIQIYVDENYVKNGVESKFTVGDSGSGVFFVRNTDSAASGDRFVSGKVVEVVDGFAVIEMDMTSSANWNHNIKGIRFDVGTGLYDFAVRYIHYVEKDTYEADVIEIEDIVAPETGYDLDETVKEVSGLVEVLKVVWTPDEFIEYNYDGTDYVKYDAEKVYTVTITARIPLGTNMKFAEGTTATVNGEEAVLTLNDDGTVTIAYTFEETAPYADFSMEITGPEEIRKEGRTAQYRLVIDGDIPVKTASWSIAPEFDGYAVINETNGKLTPMRNVEGLKIIATSHYNSAVTAEYYVTLEGQGAESIVYYEANTTDAVTNMPDPTAGGATVKLTDQVPVRTGYEFVGWSASEDSRDVITNVVPEEGSATVYAVWDKLAAAYEFDDGTTNNKLGAGSMKIAQTNATGKVANGYWELTTPSATGQHDLRLYANFGGMPVVQGDKIVVRLANALDGSGDNIELYTHKLASANHLGASISSTGLDDYVIYELDLARNALYLQTPVFSQFWFDPHNGLSETSRIDYIRVYSAARDITFNANAGSDTVEGMPENGIIAVGETLKIAEKPTRAGYEFLGWAKTADATETKSEFFVADNMTVYAIWVKAIEVVNPELVDLGAPTEDAVVVTADPETVVTVTVTTAEGETVLTAITDENGIAVVDLTVVEGDITAATATADSAITKVVLTDSETAAALVEAAGMESDGETNVIIKHNGVDEEGKDGTDKYPYDTTVETVKPTGGSVKPSGQIGGVGEVSDDELGASGDIKADMASAGEILLNFNNKYEADFFPTASLRQFTLNGVSDSVITFTNKGKASGSNDSPALFTTSFELDAATHPYIVMKIRNSTDSACRIYFRTSEAGFAEARALTKNIASDYTMVVYDMSTIADWKGTVTGMFFSFGATAGELVEIDWIMFTDKLPESMEEIAGTKELFPVVNKNAMPFEDVKNADWFYGEVASAYRLGFVEGQSEKVYNPQGNVTVAEVITLAVRLNYSYNGKELPEVAEGAEWYSNYVNAAVREGIIKNTQFADYNAPALRKEVAQIMYKALPSDYLKAINMFTSIPDVSTKDPAYGAIRKLYNAGILMGMDGAYNFYPDNNVTRAEIAAVVNRMALPANRKRVVTEAELESRRKYYYAEDLETATLGNCYETKLKIKGDFAYATGKSGDPIVYLANVVGQLNGKELTKITVALKWDETKIKANPVMFFTTPSGGWAAGRMLSSKNTGEKTENGSTIFTLDPKSNGQFADTITAIRFDPFDAKDIEFAIEYIIIE